MTFNDKVVILIGASDGIGAATAIKLSEEGARVVIVGRHEARLKAVEAKCKKSLVIRADITNEDDVQLIMKETIDKLGKLDILINNAGIISPGSLLDGNILKSYDDTLNVNVRAVVHVTSLAAPYLIKTKGNVVNVSGAGARCEVPGMSMLCTSEAALDTFTRCAALELAPFGVRVNAVSPGPVKTKILEKSGIMAAIEDFEMQTALKRISEPDEIADLILFLASDRAKGVTGSNYAMDNGFLLRQ